MKKCVFILAFLAFCMLMWAQDKQSPIELKVDKKIIHPELLGYNENTALEDILQVLPELVNRASGTVLANYSVQLDGKDVGKAKDAVLIQTKLIEIDCIEVTTAPSASEQQQGQGGTINVRLRKLSEGTHGMVHLGASTEAYVEPAFYLGFKKEKLEIRTALVLDYYAPRDVKYRETLRKQMMSDPHRTLYMENDTAWNHQLGQSVKLDLNYAINEQNNLRLWIMESGAFGWQNGRTKAESHRAIQGDSVFYFRFGNRQQRTVNRNLSVVVQTEYKHFFRNGGEFVWEMGYNYMPDYLLKTNEVQGLYFQDLYNVRNLESSKDHEATMMLKTKQPVPIPDPAHSLNMTVGANASYNYAATSYSDSLANPDYDIERFDTHSSAGNVYVSPFMEWEYQWKGLSAKAGVRYQYYRRDITHSQLLEEDADPRRVIHNHDVTANINVGYAVNNNHHLRWMLARNLTRPSALQAYPGAAVDWSKMVVYINGVNTNMHTYSAEMDYVFDWEGNGHDLTLDAGLRYYHSCDLIQEEKWVHEVMPIFTIDSCYNGGHRNLGVSDLSLSYRYKGFSFAFAFNTYFAKKLFYYNISLSPIYAFPREWYLAGRFTYNSRVQQGLSYLGDCFYAQLRLHKNIGHWSVYLEMDDIFDYRTTDKTVYSDNEYMLETYDLYKRGVALGFSYKF